MFNGSKADDIIRAYLVTGINHRHDDHLRCLVVLVKVVGLLVSLPWVKGASVLDR